MARDSSDRRITVLVVPQEGSERVRQVSIPLGRLRLLLVGAASVLGVGLLGIALLVSSMPDRMMYDEVVQENLRLKARLQQIERTMDEANETLRRLRLYDTRLRDLQPEGFPGFGPLELEEFEAAGLTETPLEMSGIGMVEPSELGIPMDELGGEELVPVVDGSALAWAQALHVRSQRTLQMMRQVEPQVGWLLESAEDYRSMQAAFPTQWPVKGVLTSGFGYRRSPFTRAWRFHSGIDLSAPRGTRIRSPGSGVVIYSGYASGYGRMLEIDHGYGITSRLAHNSRLLVRKGATVREGQFVATVGSTGRSTGPHLHYELLIEGERVDPLEYIAPPSNESDSP